MLEQAGLIRLTRAIAADPDAVVPAWTGPEHMEHRSAPGDMDVPVAEVDLRVASTESGISSLAPGLART